MLSQEATASHPRGLQHCSNKEINTSPFPSLEPEPGTGGGARPKRPVSLTTESKPIQDPQKFGELTGSFEKAPSLSQTQAPGYNPREKKEALSPSFSYPPGDALTLCAHVFSLYSYVAIAAATDSHGLRRRGSWELAKICRRGLRPLSSCMQIPKD